MNKLLENFKRKLSNGEYVIGPFMKTCDPAFVEIAGYAGFDFVILDTEHGPASIETLQNHIRAAIVSDVLPVIRSQDDLDVSIGKALDIGAFGVQIPQIKTAKQGEDAVRAGKFYPKGERGVCKFVRAANYSAMDKKEYFTISNEALVILQIEGQEAINNLDAILEVSGVDIIFVGPYDLSQSLGVTGDVGHPKVMEKMNLIVDKAKAKNRVVGTFIDTIEDIEKWKRSGVQYLSYSVDVGIFFEGCKRVVNSARGL